MGNPLTQYEIMLDISYAINLILRGLVMFEEPLDKNTLSFRNTVFSLTIATHRLVKGMR